MKVTYAYEERSIVKHAKGPYLSFLCADGFGSYFSQGIVENHSFYQGFASRYPEDDVWTMFTFINRISPTERITEVRQDQGSTILSTPKGNLTFFCSGKQRLQVLLEEKQDVILSCDPKKIYDFSTLGRNFSFFEENGIQFIEYTKKQNNADAIDYQLYLGIKGCESCSANGEWVPKRFSYDQLRSNATDWYIYDNIRIVPKSNTLTFVQGRSKEEVIKLFEEKESYHVMEKPVLQIGDDEFFLAYAMAKKSLHDLYVKPEGIYAGYYWFFHFWTRDEAITLGGMRLEEENEPVKHILGRMFSQILEDGRMPNRFPPSTLGTSDGGGWAAKRFLESIEMLSKHEQKEIFAKLETSVERLLKHHTTDDFDMNGEKETWMDTTGGLPDTRAGARIEMQALRLNMYHILAEHGNAVYAKREAKLAKKVKKLFFDGTKLADGATWNESSWTVDWTQRPNIFLAYYMYPQLMEPVEWEAAFDFALEKLWLPWGGLATIAQDHEWFQKYYTGENNKSYHRGDAWFFVNHMAAIAMRRVQREKYKKQIAAIRTASMKEIFEMGIIGGNAEVSSAAELRPEGTWQQAWSCATFIEFVHELCKP